MFPISEEARTYATIIGIDPGTSRLGVAEYRFDLLTLKPLRIKAYTLHAEKLYLLRNDHLIEQMGERAWRIHCLQRRLLSIFRAVDADSVVYEHPFYNARRPAAFMSLLECKAAIVNACVLYDSTISPIGIDPSSIKNSVGGKGNATKDDMRDLVTALYPESNLILPQGQLDEHSCDALAVAHCRFQRLLSGSVT